MNHLEKVEAKTFSNIEFSKTLACMCKYSHMLFEVGEGKSSSCIILNMRVTMKNVGFADFLLEFEVI